MINASIAQCLEHEQSRGLSQATLKELARYLREFGQYCHTEAASLQDLTADFLRRYVQYRGADRGPDLIKAVVWSLRKFGAFLALRQLVPHNPAKPLRHPKMSPRSELPSYLSETQLAHLLHTAAEKMCLRDLAVISLISSTGMRPSSVAALNRSHFSFSGRDVMEKLKGGGVKKTALSASAATIVREYLNSRTDNVPALFLTDRGKPVSISCIQRMVKDAGAKACLPTVLTCNVLRHTFAVHAADRHGKVVTKSLLGHRHIATTSVYTHLSASHFLASMNEHPFHVQRS